MFTTSSLPSILTKELQLYILKMILNLDCLYFLDYFDFRKHMPLKNVCFKVGHDVSGLHVSVISANDIFFSC